MRVPVELRRCYRLLNHGPTTLITSAAGGRRNVMAAAWVMPLSFDPPRLAAVIDCATFTRELVDASRELVVNLPTVEQIELVYAAGKESGRTVDKFAAHGLASEPASLVGAPLLTGCVGWLECRAAVEPAMEDGHDLFVLDVVAAWAEGDLFREGSWQFGADQQRTVHHVAGGVFFATGSRLAIRPT